MNVIIIDDEPKARRLLSTILTECCPLVTDIHEAGTLLDGVQQIRKHQPDVVFLDIEMPDHMGFDIGNFLARDEMTFNLIFTTAYHQYAIKAFELNAIDYLLKPIRPKQVNEALHKAQQRINSQRIHQQLNDLQAFVRQNELKKIAVPVSNGVLFVKLDDIICIEADGMYTKLHSQSRGIEFISKPLKYFASILEASRAFYRPHRSFLINTDFIKRYMKKDGHSIIMDNDIEVPISRNNRDSFLEVLQSLS